MAFRAAVARETDKIVVTPGVGDRPLVVSSLLNSPELVQLVFQFRGFAFAAAPRLALSGLQPRDAAVLDGFLLSVAPGAPGSFTRLSISGPERPVAPRAWVSDSLHRPG